MITSIRLVNFKNFADETLRVGPFTVIVGANASGKSNIRDAFRVLHGIGRGYTLAEVIGGKYGAGGRLEWEPIRGATTEIVRVGQSGFTLRVSFDRAAYSYSIDITPGPSRLSPFSSWGETHTSDSKQAIYDAFANMRFFDLAPSRMRQPAFPGQTVLGDSGENLPTVLHEIYADPERRKTLIQWTQELTPMDVQDFKFPVDPSGLVHLVLCEANGREVSAYAASDGTLRFLAILAALLGESPKGLYFFEELDTGIHPARLSLLLELIERQTTKHNVQVVTTTHAPNLLTFINDSTFEHLSVVCRLEDSHDAIIRPVAELPNARELRASGRGLGELLTEGWMETALAFTEGEDEEHDE